MFYVFRVTSCEYCFSVFSVPRPSAYCCLSAPCCEQQDSSPGETRLPECGWGPCVPVEDSVVCFSVLFAMHVLLGEPFPGRCALVAPGSPGPSGPGSLSSYSQFSKDEEGSREEGLLLPFLLPPALHSCRETLQMPPLRCHPPLVPCGTSFLSEIKRKGSDMHAHAEGV